MNENDQTQAPPPIAPASPTVPPPLPPLTPPGKPLSWWLRQFLACNPFYPVSAALLLYGCYRISMDAPMFNQESARLIFNFTSVQVYEVLLVLVAIFLAGCKLWYDSTLLVGLENLMVFVPFILISQAALTGDGMAEAICAAGVVAAVLRFGSLKRYFTQVNLPDRLLGAGFVLLVLNVALPFSYRHFQETKFGTHLEFGPAYDMNESAWLLMVPIVLALANWLPRARAAGDLLPQHRWLPMGMFSVWMLVTGVHLYALDYVYDYYLRPELFAPAACVLAWTIFLRYSGNLAWLKNALAFPALLAPMLAAVSGGTRTYLILCGLNLVAYAVMSVRSRNNRLAPQLVFASVLMLIAGLPEDRVRMMVPMFSCAQWVGAAVAAYLIFWIAWLRNAKLAVLGSMIVGAAIGWIFRDHAGAVHWALQGSWVFLLLHSLRWHDTDHADANKVRALVGLAWVVQSFVWINSDADRFWMPWIPSLLVLMVYCVCFPCRGIWRLALVPAAATLVLLSVPVNALGKGILSAPAGLLAMIASFAFLAFGTVAALTRHLWHKPEDQPTVKSPAANVATP